MDLSAPSPLSWLGPAVGSHLPPGCFVLPHDAVAGSPGPLAGRAGRRADFLALVLRRGLSGLARDEVAVAFRLAGDKVTGALRA